MKQMRKPNPGKIAVIGQQRPEPGINYILNPCLIREGAALFNPLTEEAIIVENVEKERTSLVQKWYLVPKDFDLVSVTHIVRQQHLEALAKPTGKKGFTIFTSTACNASCEYCFERGCDTLNMSEQTALDVANYIAKNRKNSQTTISWFGGEPLINTKAIDIICSSLSKKSVDYVSHITTNGYLFSECTDAQIRLWRLKTAQFTLDDVGEEYDRIKGLKDGYSRLQETIERLAELGVHSTLRIHYDPEKGAAPCYRVADEMRHHKDVSMYCRILYGNETEKDYAAVLEFEEYLIRNGMMKPKFPTYASGTHCMGDRRSHATITPDGSLSPCEHYAYGEHMYGSIYTRNQQGAILAKWSQKEKHIRDECRSCPLYACCEKIVMCPAEGSCEKGYKDYQIAQIKRALRYGLQDKSSEGIKGATKEELATICGVC